MIKIKIKNNQNLINEVEIKGHANYDEYGKDIICASVSSIATTSINAIIAIDSDAIEYEDNDGYLMIKQIKDNENANKILTNLVNMLTELASNYPNNIKIRKEDEQK